MRPDLQLTPQPGKPAEQAERLTELVLAARSDGVFVLSGAGLSTDSGIPDYRGATGRLRPATPMTFQEFTSSVRARQRYWARSHRGWRTIARTQPNAGHRAVARLQQAGLLSGVVTQNVDGLHQEGGAYPVIELHGGLDRVVCLACRAISDRDELDARLTAANPELQLDNDNDHRNDLDRDNDLGSDRDNDLGSDRDNDFASNQAVKPDGDVDLSEDEVATFRVVDCLDCGSGPLKPDVVFFGENVPPERVAASYALVESSGLALVLGSSLTVASGFRFVRRAASRGIGVVIVNQGATRGDQYAQLTIDAPLGEILPAVADRATRAVDRTRSAAL